MRLKVLFKTKGGHKEGMGDVTSSLAIADEFREQGHEVLFIINNNQSVINLISQNDFEYRIAKRLVKLKECIIGQSIDIAILNQMNTPEDEALIFKRNSKMLVTVDDTGNAAKLADMCFNVLYPIDNSYSDFKYIALSLIFQQKHKIPKVIKEQIEMILITQGGSDTYGYTPKIVRALYNIPINIGINVVLGSNFSHYQELDETLHKAPRDFHIIEGKNDLSDLMLQADLAISAGGNTLFELACLGVPTVVICGEPFEVETAKRLEKEGFCKNLGFGKHIDIKDISNIVNDMANNFILRETMSVAGKKIIDGYGIKRIVEKTTELFKEK